jgi:glycosyltransferase involved in cell wall biosynthesis
MSAPTVSVVVPTHRRGALVVRAVHSVLAQTWTDLEVIVVQDGVDTATTAALAAVDDRRLRTIHLPEPQGGSGARNAGVSAARAEWIAFLDDDDEWQPEKLAVQLDAARRLQDPYPIVACRLVARSPGGSYVWPRRTPRTGEPLSDYLLARNSLFQGEGLVQTSTLLTRRDLLLRVPFRPGLPRHQEWDWLLRAAAISGSTVCVVPKALVIWHVEEARASISRGHRWRQSVAWIRESRHLVTRRAYASFLLVVAGAGARQEGDWVALPALLREAVRIGKPAAMDYLLYAGMWLVPRNLRRWLRRALPLASGST